MTTEESDIIQLRCDPANRKVLEQGVHITFFKLALGEDGVFEFYIEGVGKDPLPDHHATPPVPLADSK